MTRNRKADLQRKLAMAAVATPPDGLADRIKNEIPNDLRFAPERARKQMRSAMFNLRIAASIVFLVSSLYFVVHLLSRPGSNTSVVATLQERAPAPAPIRQANVTLPNTPPQPGSMRTQQTADLPTLPGAPPSSSIGSGQPSMRLAEKKHEEAVGMTAGAPAYVDTVEAAPAPAEPIIVTSAAPSQGAAAEGFAPERATSDLAPTAKTSAARSIASTQAGGSLAPPPPAAAPELPGRAARDVATARNFVAIEESIDRGETPRNGDFDVIVRHFSAPENIPSGTHVELEASTAPLDATKRLLRVSVDAPASSREDITLTFGDAIESHRALTRVLAPNETALYEIEFKRTATPDQIIASVKVGEVTRIIRGSDLHPWNFASTRMKRASLAAAWAHTLQSRNRADAIVVRAREAHIDDLADLAERVERNR